MRKIRTCRNWYPIRLQPVHGRRVVSKQVWPSTVALFQEEKGGIKCYGRYYLCGAPDPAKKVASQATLRWQECGILTLFNWR